ncbi:MAG: carboxypeptidase-like regulatory domain-containing protein, partial [Saprospiraceae bacterium]|nr:carboxypeptidase-like regulatory domain-containing protein [Saprospiraceae bacterium]
MSARLYTLLVLSFCFLQAGLHGQSVLQTPVDFSCKQCLPAAGLVQLSKQTGVNIVFSDRFFDGCLPLNLEFRQSTLKQVLDQLTACGRVGYRMVGDQIVLYRKNSKRILSGFIEDAETGERLIGAGIRVLSEKNIGAISNEYGFFSFRLEEGEYTLNGGYVGYQPTQVKIDLTADKIIHIRLYSSTKLKEVVVTADLSQEEKERKSGSPTHLNLVQLRMLPMPGGEADLLRQTALQPGIQTGTDGLGGLHVRGGNADQNLFLLDDVPVYSPSHALGLFSIYNPATVSSVRLWKGDFPARYSGRTSSVIDVRMRDGSLHDYKAQVSAGLFASSGVVEGPIVKGKASFLVGARATYFEPWVRFFSNRGNLLTFSGDQIKYRFFDTNVKLNYLLSDKDRLYFSYYRGGDLF